MNPFPMILSQKRRRRQRQFSLRRTRKRSMSIQTRIFLIVSGSTLFLWIISSWRTSEIKDEGIHNYINKVKQLKAMKQRLKDDCIEFPASITNEEWERIEHPVSAYQSWYEPENMPEESKAYINVPYMYGNKQLRETLGNSGQRLMTKAEADTIGSHVYLNTNTLQLDTKQCSRSIWNKFRKTLPETIKLETINVMIASFRDGTMCKNTIQGIFGRAKHPQRIRVTVVDQVLEPDDESSFYNKIDDLPCTVPKVPCNSDPSQVLCRYKKQIDTLSFPAMDTSGPTFARHLAYRLYRGESFVLQCDSHVEFTKNWDTDIIEQWYSTKNEMAVLSVYPDRVGHMDTKTGERLRSVRGIMCSTIFEDGEEGIHLRHDEEICSKLDFEDQQLQLEPLWGAGFSFSRGHFVVQVPYDLYLPNVFQGEESNIGIRAFTYGYDFYAPSRPVVFHYYKYPDGVPAVKNKNGKRLKYWDLPTYDEGIVLDSMRRLNTIIELGVNDGNDGKVFPTGLKEYGLGNVRSSQQYYSVFGFHTHNQTIEDNLCMFVASKSMNELFLPALREDTMGIDYNHANLRNFAFKDKWPCPDYWWKGPDCRDSSE